MSFWEIALEESRLISRGIIQRQDEGEPTTFAANVKKGKGKGIPSKWNPKKLAIAFNNNRRDLSKFQCFRCDKFGHIA